MESIWKKTAKAPVFACQEKDIKTDVLIIGGGMAGVLCAYLLHQAGVDYQLAEADRIGNGITKNTTAKLTVQHGLVYHSLLLSRGISVAKGYLAIQSLALEHLNRLCRQIPCDWQEQDAFVYSLTNRNKLEAEAKAYQALGLSPQIKTRLPLPFAVAGALGIPRQAQFHPLKFLYGIAQDLHIFEHTKVRELAPGRAITDRGTIQAKKIIVATHFPLLNKHGAFFLKLYQHRSYVLALQNVPLPDGMYVDESLTGLSFRSYKDLLLLGGGSHRTGKKGGGFRELEDFVRSHYPHATEVARFSTQDCMSLDQMPYVGQYSPQTPDCYVATGFHKWGMTSSMAAAMILCDLVQGKDNPYASLFSPSRSLWHPQLFVNGVESLWGLLRPTAPRCPHLGCALRYNPQEHSWDCPCHGSRFTKDGQLIDNPATDDLFPR